MDEKTLKLRKAKPCAVCGGRPELVELTDDEHGHTYGLRCDSGHEHRERGGTVLTTGANFADLGKCVRRWNFIGRRWVGRAAEQSGARNKSRGKQLGAVNGSETPLKSEPRVDGKVSGGGEGVGGLVAELKRLNASYDDVCKRREVIPFKWTAQPDRDALQDQANQLAGEIMRTERRIIVALLAGAGEAGDSASNRERKSPNDQAHLRQPDHDSRKETK